MTTTSPAFSHWESLIAWWVARRNETAAIGRKHPPRKARLDPGEQVLPIGPDLNDTVPTALAQARQRMKDDASRTIPNSGTITASNVTAVTTVGFLDTNPPPDEGGPVTDADIETMRKAYAALPPAASTWATNIMKQGNNGHPWNKLSVNKTVRRYELYRGVKTLAEWVGFPIDTTHPLTDDAMDNANQIIRAIVHAVQAINTDTDEPDPTMPPGQLLGTLSFGDATRFAQTAYDLATERYTLVYDDNGTCRLEPVA